MKLNSKLSLRILSILLCNLMLQGCITDERAEIAKEQADASPNNILFVVVDKSESVKYLKEGVVKSIIKTNFDNTFKYMKSPCGFFHCNISTQTNVVPHPYIFSDDFPVHDRGQSTFKQEVNNWEAEKTIWINNSVDTLAKDVVAAKTGNTDVFGMFQAIDQIAKNLHKEDTLNVLVFSDMAHSTTNYELSKLLDQKDPAQFGKEEATRVMSPLTIGNYQKISHPYFNFQIVTPDNFSNTSKIVTFWNAFFEKWGLPKEQLDYQ